MDFRLQQSLLGAQDRTSPDWEEVNTRRRKKEKILGLDISGDPERQPSITRHVVGERETLGI